MNKWTSALPTLLLLAIILILGFYTELYYHVSGNKTISMGKVNQPFHLLTDFEFHKIEIEHKNDYFLLSFEDGVWSYRSGEKALEQTAPLEARSDFIKKLIQTFATIKVNRELHNDSATKSNYLLDNPWLKVKLETTEEENLTLSFGLNNPISNTSYLLFHHSIYEINSIPSYLSQLTQSDFLSRNPFHGTWDGIKRWQLKKANQLLFSLQRENSQWTNHNDRPIESQITEQYLSQITKQQALIIIDEPEPSVAQTIQNSFERTLYEIELQDQKERIHQFQLTGPVSQIPSAQGNLNQVYVLRRKDKQFQWIISKDFFSALTSEQKNFK